ncbi:MAG: RNA pseudouridine synthase, partial [Microbacteriaceae bacterium]|nr:RNA pseudouridine synthase [Microbacteriaceae bacterium]
MTEDRLIQVPEGISGTRADAGIARLLGMSRSAVADLIEAGLVQ